MHMLWLSWARGSAAAAQKNKMEMAWTLDTDTEKWWQHSQAGATVDITRPPRKTATQELLLLLLVMNVRATL